MLKRASRAMVALVLLILATGLRAWAQDAGNAPGRDLAFEEEIYGRLAEVAPDAVPAFRDATIALDAGDLETARLGFERVLILAPGFPDAARRLSQVELILNDVEAALEHARQAYAAEGSPLNELTLAFVLVWSRYPSNASEALSRARAAAEALPEDPVAQEVLVLAGAMNSDQDAIRDGTAALIRIEPDAPGTHYCAGLMAADDGRFEEAEQELLLAQSLGMPSEAVQEALATGIGTRALFQRWVRRAVYATGLWLVGLVALYAIGSLLSRMTQAAIFRAQSATATGITWGERLTRGVYRVIITIACVYFYVSIPFLVWVVLALGGSVEYLLFRFGLDYQGLVFAVAGAAVYTAFAVVHSLFIRVLRVHRGRPLPREEAPALFSVVEKVAQRLGTRPIEAVDVAPGTGIGVEEQGGAWARVRGQGRRCLMLGLGALPGMTQGQFEAIIAHEYGHFVRRDTAGGLLADRAQSSMNRMALALTVRGLARINPVWLFLRGFSRLFRRITLGASRLQEMLADRYAAEAYGADLCANALMHLVRRHLVFDMQVRREISAAQAEARVLRNLYTLPAFLTEEEQSRLQAKLAAAMERPATRWDSHPAPGVRVALLQRLETLKSTEEIATAVWDLLPSAEALQMEMTITVAVRQARNEG